MELPTRPKGDQYTKPGEYPALRWRIRAAAVGLSIPAVVVYVFDKRTRLLPYFFTSHRMAPAGPRAVGAALYDSGLTKTRVVLQQWNPNFRASQGRLDGERHLRCNSHGIILLSRGDTGKSIISCTNYESDH